jgi:hypothetical protein
MRVRPFFALAFVLHVGCAARQPDAAEAPRVSIPNPVGPSVVSSANLYLRNRFDKDPTVYIGRFLATGDGVPDETSAMKRTCSQYITYKKVEGGGTLREEYFKSSVAARAALNVPVLQSATGGGERDAAVLIRYKESAVLQSDITDPAAFESCCSDSGNMCTAEYVSEFIEGTGSVYYALGSAADLDVQASAKAVGADVEVHAGMAWQRATTFDNQVYFAFKTTPTGVVAGSTSDCAFKDRLPTSSTGQYFLGTSALVDDEQIARDDALLNGRTKVVDFLGQDISNTGSKATTLTRSGAGVASSTVDSSAEVVFRSQAVARYVKEERWCVEKEPTPGGLAYKAHVLVHFPSSELDAARQALAAPSSSPAGVASP